MHGTESSLPGGHVGRGSERAGGSSQGGGKTRFNPLLPSSKDSPLGRMQEAWHCLAGCQDTPPPGAVGREGGQAGRGKQCC